MRYYKSDGELPVDVQKAVGLLQNLPATPVGVDMGAHSVKCVTTFNEEQPRSFRSVYATTARPPTMRDVLGGKVDIPDPVLVANGVYTLFGKTAMDNVRATKLVRIDPNERVKSNTTKTFFVGALAAMLPPGDYRIVAVLGLPVSDLTEKNVEEMRSRFAGYYEFYSPKNGNIFEKDTWRVLVDRVAVIEQPRGSVYNAMFNVDGTPTDEFSVYQNNHVAIIDSGGSTLDWLYMRPTKMQDGRIVPVAVPEFSGSIQSGTQMMIDMLRSVAELRPYLSSISPSDWDVIIADRSFMDNVTGKRVDLTPYINRAQRVISDMAVETLRDSLGGETGSVKISRVVLTGGSVWMIAGAMRKLYGEHRVAIGGGGNSKPWFFNVLGFYKLAKFFVNSMGQK